jgi:hypothetical protein
VVIDMMSSMIQLVCLRVRWRSLKASGFDLAFVSLNFTAGQE